MLLSLGTKHIQADERAKKPEETFLGYAETGFVILRKAYPAQTEESLVSCIKMKLCFNAAGCCREMTPFVYLRNELKNPDELTGRPPPGQQSSLYTAESAGTLETENSLYTRGTPCLTSPSHTYIQSVKRQFTAWFHTYRVSLVLV